MKLAKLPLADIADINPLHERRLAPETEVSFLGMADVSGVGTTTSGETRPYREVRLGYTPFRSADLLLAKITPCFQNGKIAQAEVTHEIGAGSTEFHVIRPRQNLVDARYLLRFLRQDWVRVEGELRMTGSGGQRRVPESYLRSLSVPVPPLAEQRHIATLLDQVDTLRAKRREAIALLDDLASSLFSDMFGDVIKRGGGVPLFSVADISSGITKGRKVPSGDLRTTPYLAVANVQDRALDLSTVKEIAASVAEIERYKLLSEDLLLTEGGDPDKLGRGTLWRDELPVCIHQNHVFRVRVKTRAEVDPLYLNWVMSSSYGKGYFLRTAKQTTGIASINKTQLGEFPLLVPPIARQKDFRSRIESVQESQQAHRTHLATLDELFTSLQHRAFSGTLWEHDATGEAA